MSRVECFIGGKDLYRSVVFEQVFRNGSLDVVTISVREMGSLGGVHFEMWTFELVVFFGEDDGSSKSCFSLEILLVNGRLCQIRLDVVKLAQMPATTAL